MRSHPILIALSLLMALAPLRVPAQVAIAPDVDPRIERMAAEVSEARLRELVDRLAAFGTRHTLSDTTSPTRGIGAARQWILEELTRSSPKLQVGFDTYQLAQQGRITRQVELRNVVAVLPGRSARRVYVSGHYDSVNIGGQRARGAGSGSDPQLRADQDYDVAAPGANDDGSGTALTMELARVLAGSGVEFDATLVFALWAGEEQGLFGSNAHAGRIAGEHVAVEADLNSDIVGNVRGGNGVGDGETVRVYAAGPADSMSRSLARYVRRMAALYVPSHTVRLMAREDRFNRGGDQSSFIRYGYPAIVLREANENFDEQHGEADTPDGVDERYLAQNARIALASAASLALAPPAPAVTGDRGQVLIGRQPSGYDARLRWIASPGAVAYRVYWRDTWTNDWQQSRLVGAVTELVLPDVSIDDFVFGVAAVGKDGHESLVRAFVASAPPRPDIKFVQ